MYGEYDVGGAKFGSGKYGDLSAMMAAIFLDRESRHAVLDKDLSFGSIREPLVKFVSLLRNMEYKQTFDGIEFGIHNGKSLIGEEVYELPDVFGFFLSDYSPPGDIAKASLVAPEAMLLHKARGLLNTMMSLVKFG